MVDRLHAHRRPGDAPPALPAGIYQLADHLDAGLAMAEDLVTETLAVNAQVPGMAMRTMVRRNSELLAFLDTVRSLELAMTARLLQARKKADDLKRHDGSFRPLVTLYSAGTAALVDAAAALGDESRATFETGNVSQAFLRSRGMIAADAAGFEGIDRLAVTEDYLVAGKWVGKDKKPKIHLGTLMDLVATFLDTLDRSFDLFSDEDGRRPTAPRLEHGEPAIANLVKP